jgi:S-adenosylmethionine:tRNA ribosyltransferase-isomerase
MRTSEFQFDLPPELIAQSPAPRRDESRLLVFSRPDGGLQHRRFPDLAEFLRPGDLLVLNNSRVIPARLRGLNSKSGGQFEVLLVEENAPNDWWVMLRPGKRARIGAQIQIKDLAGNPANITATVIDTNPEGHRRLRFDGVSQILDHLDALGEIPLPPYIVRENLSRMEEDRQRYQTVFAQPPGSVAAPTAGLHFTAPFLEQLRARGIQTGFVTLHVGLGTFAPVKADTLDQHVMHEERYVVTEETARLVNEAKASGRRVIAVGTTSLRVLESVAALMPPDSSSPFRAEAGRTRIFIHPPYDFRIVDALLTNFHLPCSTLLMLISAFAAPGQTTGREQILAAYAEAVRQRYRFFSYGDAMFIS